MPDAADPRGLIREAYRIDDIAEAECRAIFLDWAVGVSGDVTAAHIRTLLARHGDRAGHPMTAVLRAALAEAPPPRRRGGFRGRRRH